VLVAIGGNALVAEGQSGTYSEQVANARAVAGMLGDLHAERRLVVTHGNGPQVGALALQQEAARGRVPVMPLDALDAMTQGLLGYLLVGAIRDEIPGADVVALVTRVEVDPDDPAFEDPTKPIGPFYEEDEARRLAGEHDWHVVEDGGRGWRRVVASPMPLRAGEAETIAALVERDTVVVAGGGGGIPVIETADGYEGVAAVIDKDRLAVVLAEAVGAELLLLLTGVPRIALDFGKPGEREVERLSAGEARHHLEEGQFPAGSMGPKVEAALSFVEDGGSAAIVSDFAHAAAAVAGDHGTWVVA
jgi:carbamate kinase